MTKWTVLDTETTGFSHDKDRLIEFAAARFDPQSGVLLDETLHLYINPGKPIPKDVSLIHGITDEHVKDKPKFAAVSDEILGFIKGSVLVIHNAPFDMRFLNAEMKRAKKTALDDLVEEVICTRRLSNLLRPGKPASLNVLCDFFGIDRTERSMHGALIDCKLLAAVYPHLARMEAEFEQKLEHLLPFSRKEPLPRNLDKLGNAHVALSTMIKTLEKEQERIEEEVRVLTGGKPYTNEEFEVSFTADTVSTDYKRIVTDNLAGIDLKPYQKPKKGSMSIKSV